MISKNAIHVDRIIWTRPGDASHLYDFTISAPKSVSVMAILGKDERLIEAHSRLLPTTAPPGISRRATTTTPAGSSDSKGRDCGFEICGISPELLARFSQQSRQRDEAIDKFVAENGRRPTDNEVAVLV